MYVNLKAPITPRQITLLHVAKSQLGLSDEDYRSILDLYGGVTTSKNLRLESFWFVLRRLKELGFKMPENKVVPLKTNNHDGTMPPSAAQLKLMEQLLLKAGFLKASQQEAFIRRMIRKPEPAMKYEANLIIEALKKMVARGYRAGGDAGC